MTRLLPLALVSTAFLPAVTLADEVSGLYLGAGFGDFSSQIDDISDVDIDFDEDSDSSKIFGGWRFNRFFALQLDYIEFGDASADLPALGIDIESDVKGLAPNLVGTLPLGPIELFVKGGVVFYDLELTVNGESLVDESDQDVFYGAGVGLTLLSRLALRAEYEVVEVSELDEAEGVWVTAAWRF